MKKTATFLWISVTAFLYSTVSTFALPLSLDREEMIKYTSEWDGERFPDGRPKVPDEFLERMKYVVLEEAWGTLRKAGYHNKYEVDWEILHPEKRMVGRALTAVFLPSSPELKDRMTKNGHDKGEEGPMLIWPINRLVRDDVYVADSYGKIKGGTIMGDNYATAIYENSGNGVVFYGAARDLNGTKQIKGFNAFIKSWHPSANDEMMLAGINTLTRIGEAVVLPGDIVLAVDGGVIFIPPHLAEKVIVSSEVTRLVDSFRREQMEKGKYSLDEVYTSEWTGVINEDFYDWLETNKARLHEQYGVATDTIERIINEKSRDWQEWFE